MDATSSTNMEGRPFPMPERLTFGVEFEFLIPTLLEGEHDSSELEMGAAPILRVPRDIDALSYDPAGTYTPELNYDSQRRDPNQEKWLNPNDYEVEGDSRQEYVLDCVRNTLREAFGQSPSAFSPQKIPSGRLDEFSTRILSGFSGWSAEHDGSVYEPGFSQYKWVAVEIRSPVEFSCEAAFKAISYAASEITKKFRCRVNPSTGFHVHVGQGAERFPLEAVRRIAGLFWATEPLLLTLQNPLRRVTPFCRSVRETSELARGANITPLHQMDRGRGKCAIECIRYLGRDRRHGEEHISARELNRNEENVKEFEKSRRPGQYSPFRTVHGNTPFRNSRTSGRATSDLSRVIHEVESDIARRSNREQVAASSRRKTARKRSIPRIEMPQYSADQLKTWQNVLQQYKPPWVSRMVPVEETSKTETSETETAAKDIGLFEGIRQIFEAPSSCHISELLAGEMRMSLSFQAYECTNIIGAIGEKRTIEFRFIEGVIDSWAETMARICVGLVRFAIQSSVDDYLGILKSCDQATREGGEYDVIDLLDDLCLFAEAEAVEGKIKRFRSQWGLRYVSSA